MNVAALLPKPASVPCNGCTACCKNDLIFLSPQMGDRPETYLTMPATNPLTGQSGLALQKGDRGCVYLGEAGCTIHDRVPAVCRTFDCRAMLKGLKSLPRAEQHRLKKLLGKQGLLSAEVIAAAKARMHTLEEA